MYKCVRILDVLGDAANQPLCSVRGRVDCDQFVWAGGCHVCSFFFLFFVVVVFV